MNDHPRRIPTEVNALDAHPIVKKALSEYFQLYPICADLIAHLDLNTMQFFVIHPEAHEALIKLQNFIAEVRKQK